MSGLKREVVSWSPVLVKQRAFYQQQRVHSISKRNLNFENKQVFFVCEKFLVLS